MTERHDTPRDLTPSDLSPSPAALPAKAAPQAPPKASSEKRKLTERQEAFCQHYLLYPVAAAAARRAGYAPKSAHAEGSRLLRNVRLRTQLSQ